MRVIARIAECLAKITAQQGPLRFERGGNQQVVPSAARVAAADAAKPAAQPGIGECGSHGDGFVEPVHGVAGLVLRGQEETLQRKRLGIARSEREAFGQSLQRASVVAEAEFKFSHSFPCKAEFGRMGRRLTGQSEGAFERAVARGPRLFVVGGGEELSRELRFKSWWILPALH